MIIGLELDITPNPTDISSDNVAVVIDVSYGLRIRCSPLLCHLCSSPGLGARPRQRSSTVASMSRSTQLRPSCQSLRGTESPRGNFHVRPAIRGSTLPGHPISGGSMSGSPERGSSGGAPCRRRAVVCPRKLQMECTLSFTSVSVVNQTQSWKRVAAIWLRNPHRCLV